MGQQKIKRIFHTWDKWECYKAGFYEERYKLKDNECKELYKSFLSDIPKFEKALFRVISEWKFSCQHYLTNEKMNRIAWLGQAAMCIEYGVPSKYRSGYFLLDEKQRVDADNMALKWLNVWLNGNGYHSVDIIGAGTKVHADIY